MKRIVGILLAVCMIFGCMTFANAANYVVGGKCGPGCSWQLFDDGSLIITGEDAMNDYMFKDAPWYYSREKIRSVIIGEGITHVGIGSFTDCTNLETVILGGSVVSMGGGMFRDCINLKKVVLSEGITRLASTAFEKTPGRTVVSLPSTLKTIEGYAFARCPGIMIELNPENKYFKLVNGVLYSADMTRLVYASPLLTGNFVIPDSVTTICEGAFVKSNLDTVVIPDSVTNMITGTGIIFSEAFVKKVVVGKNVEKIGRMAFYQCNNLEEVYILGNDTECENGFILRSAGIVYLNRHSKAAKHLLKANAEEVVGVDYREMIYIEEDFVPAMPETTVPVFMENVITEPEKTEETHAIGEVIGEVVGTDILATIDGKGITSFNINGNTAILAEELAKYGFMVTWSQETRTLNVVYGGEWAFNPPESFTSYSDKKNEHIMDVLYTDIKTYVNGKAVESFNVGGSTAIYIDSLAPYGNVAWDAGTRMISLTVTVNN